MNKSKRKEVFNKYNGHCAYCGCEITFDNFQVDHIWPKIFNGDDSIDNLMPACKECNHYKRALDLETFRNEWLGKLHTRIKRIPKNPRSEKGKKYKAYMETILKKYGITEDKPFNGKFYFEQF
ncbi:MAG: HNH endonuclease [Candidatus Njordarchaeia archaeon]